MGHDEIEGRMLPLDDVKVANREALMKVLMWVTIFNAILSVSAAAYSVGVAIGMHLSL